MIRGIRTGDFFYDTRVFLELFDRSLRADKYNKRIHREHWENIFDYLSYYLKIHEQRDISEWCDEIDDFIMNGFLGLERTVSENQLTTMCSSLRRFYICMRDNAVITFEEYDGVKAALRDNRDKWFEARRVQEENRDMEGKRKYRRPRGLLE